MVRLAPASAHATPSECTGPAPVTPAGAGLVAFCTRHFTALALAVLALAAFNSFYRLGDEAVRQWDESLYAVSALETVRTGHWVGITFRGETDYYNTKPPLNIWLIALSFKAFGVGIVPLRLASALSAWLTVGVLLWWTRRVLGPAAGLLAGLVLSTTFGFFYVHSGRTANTDPLFTLLVVLTVVTLSASSQRAWRLVWIGPILAAVFLLRGMGVVMPLLIVALAELLRPQRSRDRVAALAVGLLVGLVPVAWWVWARWQFDEWRFLERLFHYDFVARTVRQLEGHRGGTLYYLNILWRYGYEWLAAAALALLVVPASWSRVRGALPSWRRGTSLGPVMVAWAAASLLLPTVMRTKVSWYLNPFYPLFAVGVAVTLMHAFSRVGERSRATLRLGALAAIVVMAAVAAEARLAWNSVQRRALVHSEQSLLLEARDELGGRRVFHDRRNHATYFVGVGLVGATLVEAVDPATFLRASTPGEFYLVSAPVEDARLALLGATRRHWLYRRVE